MKRTLGRVSIVLVAVGLATALTEASFALGAELTFEWYVAAVACTAWWCGRRSALLAALVSSMVTDFLYLPFHRFSFGMGLTDATRLLIFVGLALLVTQLVARRTAAEKDRASQERLLAVVARELANLIRAYQAWTTLLRRDGLPGREREHAAHALARTNHALATLVGDLLDWPRLAAGRLDLELEDLDLAEVVADAVEEMREHAALHSVGLSCSLVAAPVRADRDRLHQVALSVLADALRTTPRGGTVTVSVRSTERRAVLSVHRTGAEVVRPLPRRILDPKTTADVVDATFALALARDLMRAQGGDVTMYGGGFRGEGATLLVRLPAAGTDRATAAAPIARHAG